MANHNLSRADNLYAGDSYYARYNLESRHPSGIVCDLPIWVDFGAPIAIDANYLVTAATGAELPNANTITYTPATNGTSPLDDATRASVASVVMADGSTQSVFVLDVPRNVTATDTTHNTNMTVTFTSYDAYGELMTETLSLTSTAAVAGKKAHKWIKSIAFTSAGDATTNVCNVAIGDVLGLPFRIDRKERLIPWGNGAIEVATTVVADDTSPATATTGDVRGTIDFNSASDATKKFVVWMIPASRLTKEAVFGVTQA